MCSNGYFWTYTIALIIVWIIVLTTATNNDSSIEKKLHSSSAGAEENEVENIKHCKALCKHCGCLDFYCGEECICECNDDRSDTQCIAITQANARKMNTPFEILIQGPRANNFVRNALQFELNIEGKQKDYRHKRSTITIYKPKKERESNYNNQNHGATSANKSKINEGMRSSQRLKRSNDNTFNWFSDLTNNLVRPAPLGLRKNKHDEYKTQYRGADLIRSVERSTLDNSWFLDDTPNILTPAPIIKQKISKSSTILYKDNTTQRNERNDKTRSPIKSYKRGPFLQLTVNELNGATSREVDKENSYELSNISIQDVHGSSLENEKSKDSQESLSRSLHPHLFQDLLKTKIRVPWLRPINFLEKIKSALRI